MIPKIIHYCWFGGNPLPASALKCIESWKKFLPDYEIKEWNESNFDVNVHTYTKMAFEQKRWAYLSDLVRLIVVEREGGFYFDTDVELVRRPVEFIGSVESLSSISSTHTQFASTPTAWFGWENSQYINTGLGFAATAHHPAVQAMLREYDNRTEIEGCPQLNTAAMVKCGMLLNGHRQQVCEAEILPKDFMCPYNDQLGKLFLTDNTFSIHWFTKSPHGKQALYRAKLSRIFHRIQQSLGLADYTK